jgi:hypothetical protein
VGRDVGELRLALLGATSLHFEDLVLEMAKQACTPNPNPTP